MFSAQAVPPLPIDFFNFSDPSQMLLLVGFFLTLITAVVTKKMASSQIKSLVTLTLATALAVLTTLVSSEGAWDFRAFGNAFLMTYLPAIGAYYGLWKHNAVTRALTEKTADFGILIQKRDVETETRPAGPGPDATITDSEAAVLESKNVEVADAEVVPEGENFSSSTDAAAPDPTTVASIDSEGRATFTEVHVQDDPTFGAAPDPMTGEGVVDASLEEAKYAPDSTTFGMPEVPATPEEESDALEGLEDGRLWLTTDEGWTQFVHVDGVWKREEV